MKCRCIVILLLLQQSGKSLPPSKTIITFGLDRHRRWKQTHIPIHKIYPLGHPLYTNIGYPGRQSIGSFNQKYLTIVHIPAFHGNIEIIMLAQIHRNTFHHCNGKEFIEGVWPVAHDRSQARYPYRLLTCTALIVIVGAMHILTMKPETYAFSPCELIVLVSFVINRNDFCVNEVMDRSQLSQQLFPMEGRICI